MQGVSFRGPMVAQLSQCRFAREQYDGSRSEKPIPR